MPSERARVLITVKAAPEPSKTYVDTVCVAGVRLNDDDTVEWVRIYPVAFRHLNSEQQFKKFEVIEVELNKSTTDARSESHRPNWDTLKRDGNGKPHPIAARGPILEKLIRPTMCDLRAGVEANPNAQSLGLIEVRDLRALKFEKHGPWTPKQVAGMTAAMSQLDVFGETEKVPELIPPRFKVHYDYKCMTETCKGHNPSILDFELSALQYRNRYRSDDDLKAIITQKFHTEMWNEKVRTYFFVGNFADMPKRRSFSVLGVYKPERHSDYSSTLF